MEKKKRSVTESILSKVADTLAKYQTYAPPPATDSSIEVRKKEMTSGTGFGASAKNAGAWYDSNMQIDNARIAKYKDYDIMDKEDPELSSALDIYADNATKGESETDTVIHIISKDQNIVNILEEVIDSTKLSTELWSITRELVKDGDLFEEVVVHDDNEVHRLKNLDTSKMVVVQDEWGRLDKEYPYLQKNDMGKDIAKFKDWQILHFKLAKDRSSKYGVDGSVLFPIRKVYKQLAMVEDSLVLARLTRAIQRYAYLIDTEGIDAGDSTLEYLEKVMNGMKKRRTIDPNTGQMDLEYNPMSMEEDIFVATKANSKANVKVLQGSTNLGVLADVEYFRNKKFAGVKVPKAYLSHEKDVRARAMITEQDVQFARSVRRVQIALINGLKKLFDFVLANRGIDPAKADYDIQLPALSTIDELRIWQAKQIKINVASMLHRDLKVSLHWILTNLLDYDEDDVALMIKYIEDPESLDNKVIDKGFETQQRFAATQGDNEKDDDDSKPEDNPPTRKKERPKGGQVPSKKDNQEPTKKRKDDDTPSEELIIKIKEEIKPMIEALDELINWNKK